MLVRGFCPLKNEIARFPIGFYLHLSDFDKSLLRETAGKEKIKSRTVKQKSVLHVWHEHSNSPSRFYTFLLEILTGDNWIYQYEKNLVDESEKIRPLSEQKCSTLHWACMENWTVQSVLYIYCLRSTECYHLL